MFWSIRLQDILFFGFIIVFACFWSFDFWLVLALAVRRGIVRLLAWGATVVVFWLKWAPCFTPKVLWISFNHCNVQCKLSSRVSSKLNVFLLHIPWQWRWRGRGGLVPPTVPQIWTINPQDGPQSREPLIWTCETEHNFFQHPFLSFHVILGIESKKATKKSCLCEIAI